ncbi:phosphatase PAP2 family protein [Kitasatospora kazusensis]|uniref:phosphatase PAP2 family protein n=1 Tax=Kitasatospora kazusensis TaxID=407974 RepID=UPI0031D7CFE1
MPLLLTGLLAVISWQVAVGGPLLGLDLSARHGVHELRGWLDNPWVDYGARGLADLGGAFPAIPVLLAAAVLAARRQWRAGGPRWWLPLPAAALAAVLIPLLVVPAKAWFARPGPLGETVRAGGLGWYPSGHTATSAIAYGTAALLVGRTLASPAARRWLYAATAAVCCGVGAGLVWSDYHWLLDVTASWCLAGSVLWALDRRLPGPVG